MLTQQPERLLGAYARDVAKLFALTRDSSPGDTPISRWQFQTTYPYFSSHSTRPEVTAEIAQFGGGTPAVWRPVAGFLRSYQLDGGYTPGLLLALCVVTGLAGSAVLLRRRWRADPLARSPALGALLFTASGAFVLLVSDLFEFSWRYQLPALVTLVPAGALGIAALKQTVSGRQENRARAGMPGAARPPAPGGCRSPAGMPTRHSPRGNGPGPWPAAPRLTMAGHRSRARRGNGRRRGPPVARPA